MGGRLGFRKRELGRKLEKSQKEREREKIERGYRLGKEIRASGKKKLSKGGTKRKKLQIGRETKQNLRKTQGRIGEQAKEICKILKKARN